VVARGMRKGPGTVRRSWIHDGGAERVEPAEERGSGEAEEAEAEEVVGWSRGGELCG
jgi:hypothetical protein